MYASFLLLFTKNVAVVCEDKNCTKIRQIESSNRYSNSVDISDSIDLLCCNLVHNPSIYYILEKVIYDYLLCDSPFYWLF